MKNSTKEWLYILGFVLIIISLFLGEPIKYIVPISCFVLACIIRFFIPTNQENKD